MLLRTALFEQWLQYPFPTYLENWPLTLFDVQGFLAVVIIILALRRNLYEALRDYTLAFLGVFWSKK